MGLFSKSYNCTCIICNRQYESYKSEVNGVCPDCISEKIWKGYVELKGSVEDRFPGYTIDEWEEIDRKRDGMLSSYRVVDGLTEEELRDAGTNYKTYTEEQCNQFVGRLIRSLIPASYGGIFSEGFIMPSAYAGVVVNPKDVFAIVLGSPYWKGQPTDLDVVSIAFFTNDSAAPMLAVGATFETKGFSTKNKKAREALKQQLSVMCPNLTYPIMDRKEFKSIIKKDKNVRGNIPVDVILKYVDRADMNTSPFCISSIFTSYSNNKLLNRYGYIYSDQVTNYLMNDRKSRKFWGEKLKMSSERGAEVLAASFDVGKLLAGVFRIMSKF